LLPFDLFDLIAVQLVMLDYAFRGTSVSSVFV
jgi:hypothetical protein